MDRNLFSPLGIFFLIVYGIESIVSLLANGFIIVVNGHIWLQSRKMLPCDFLLTTLSLSRFFLQGVSMTSNFAYVFSPDTYMCSEKRQAFGFSWIYLNIASLWCATWLNVFYCLKVANFAHPLFAWLKLRIGVLGPRFLGISLLAFIICSIHPFIKYFEEYKCHNLTGNLPENTSQSEAYEGSFFKLFGALQFSFSAISFSICLTASIVLLLSLWRHRRNLKKSGLSTKDLSTQAHLNVMKPLLLLLVFYIAHIPAMMVAVGDILPYDNLERLISEIFLCSYPSAHPIILIFTSPKLRKVFTHVLNLRRNP